MGCVPVFYFGTFAGVFRGVLGGRGAALGAAGGGLGGAIFKVFRKEFRLFLKDLPSFGLELQKTLKHRPVIYNQLKL